MIEKILERLETEKETANRTYGTFKAKVDLGRTFGLEKAIEIVQEVAKEYVADTNVGEWIPCSVRLPKNMQQCLTTAKIYFVPDHVDEPDNYIGVELNTYSARYGWLGNQNVIAWQPLPAPYQKGE